MKFNKGAMFGLDARVALAIVGSLSVIAGAVIYTAIEDSQVARISQDLKEIEKSVVAYRLDTGLELAADLDSTFIKNFYLRELVDNHQEFSRWKGPYIDIDVVSASSPCLKHSILGNICAEFSSLDNSAQATIGLFTKGEPTKIDDANFGILLKTGLIKSDLYLALEKTLDAGDINYQKGKVQASRDPATNSTVSVWYNIGKANSYIPVRP
tara:strand:- start:62 stop:694 length:633 start_codon:yes stop_codon:yes gene_type:complete